ncbi:MAG: hypothetical protein WEC15_00745 [Flavobacteriales bacterium]
MVGFCAGNGSEDPERGFDESDDAAKGPESPLRTRPIGCGGDLQELARALRIGQYRSPWIDDAAHSAQGRIAPKK